MRVNRKLAALLCTTAMVAMGSAAQAQDAQQPQGSQPGGTVAPDTAVADDDVIVVTGTQIRGAQVDDVLPVTVLDEKLIEDIDPASGDEIFRAIPQAGSVEFNEQNTVGGVNGARGDIASINLRGLGTGNTLTLINGRRMVLNPGFQTELFVPVVSADVNTIAPASVRRVEVLRDGASAVYGADAVAGVVNTILRSNREGGFLQGNYRASDGTGLFSYQLNGGLGFDFADGRANFTVYGGYFYENGLSTNARDYSRSSDLRPFVEGTPFEGDNQFDNRSLNSPFGAFDIQGSRATSGDTTVLRDDDFHIQPCSLFGATGEPGDGRFINLGNGLCADNGGSLDREVRYDIARDRQLFSEKQRINVQTLFNYELSDSVEFYFEGSYYRTEASRQREQNTMLSAVPIGVEATAFWNPLGAETLADGSPNPNRVDNGLGAGVGPEGRALLMEDYRFIDAGPRQGTITKDEFRLVAGLRGNIGNWDFDTGLLYAQANTDDFTANRISNTLLQDAINRTDASAYNPFNGGCLPGQGQGPSVGDCTPNPQAVIDGITIDVLRRGETTLALADFKLSRPDLFELPAGGVGIATGIEFRRETFKDDRDPRLDGTITFTNAVNGDFFGSDVLGSSPSPDTSGNREVYSAFAEALVPIVSEDMGIPLINELELQIAARFEDFSDSSSAFVPRAALAWRPISDVLLRGAWSQGFRAPNLIQINDAGTSRSNTTRLAVECVAEIIQGESEDVPDCGGQGVIDFRTGARNLDPEETESLNFGLVLTPSFIPGLTITADYWRVEQEGIIGIVGNQNAILLDLFERLQGGSNPNVVREAPTQEQLDLYAGTGINPAGDIIQILNPYQNLDGRTSEGLDFGIFYDFDTSFGAFQLQFNAARLIGFEQRAGPEIDPLFTELPGLLADIPELAPGDIAALQPINFGELLEIDGRPKWRVTGAIRWESGPVRVNLFGRYIDSVFDPGAQQDDTAEFFRVDDWFTMNFGISYRIENDTALNGTRFRFGINNIFNEAPPIADESFGFYGSLHNARGRQFSFDIRKEF
ncbi:TonB-dependent receptor domain-containing protein [Alterisphingorhabdus coralli]|uniref:TonB-dependent receptor n=1 Tax=Alterisphingorhabdus coralli TaxID=3071408 RepID=A0AA97F9Z8_9SPHN|nr:TonB-dependent receptor [Parasphingorhabdus sp. SCSIO 66989]WOE75893.1 TonB-dependent receptor [Parasphingorhabdus sp. SCSIO 66989]